MCEALVCSEAACVGPVEVASDNDEWLVVRRTAGDDGVNRRFELIDRSGLLGLVPFRNVRADDDTSRVATRETLRFKFGDGELDVWRVGVCLSGHRWPFYLLNCGGVVSPDENHGSATTL